MNISAFAKENTKSPEEQQSVRTVILGLVCLLPGEGEKSFLFLNTEVIFKLITIVKGDF